MAWNREETIKECIKELNFDNEQEAKSAIKTTLKNIINQQKIIATAQEQIGKLQATLKEITVNPLDL